MTTITHLGTVAWLVSSFALVAQQPASSPTSVKPPVKSAGLESAWALHGILDELLKDSGPFDTLLGQINPTDWVNKQGASEVYIQQWQTARTQLKDAVATTKVLAQKTESLPLALDNYFRWEALEVTARSLSEAVTRYGSRSQADQLNGLIARNFSRRERFRNYILDLSANAELNFKVADAEAQRCRGIISREPAKRAH